MHWKRRLNKSAAAGKAKSTEPDRTPMSIQQTLVIKVGTSVITGKDAGLAADVLQGIADQIGELARQGHCVLLVSSGAVGVGMERAGVDKRPKALDRLQALAALGQAELVSRWQTALARHKLLAALVLLTPQEIEDRQRYLNVRNTLLQMKQMGIIPVINENDSVSTSELQFGDNDSLAGLVVTLTDANLLAILTDRDGMYDGGDPQTNPDSALISTADTADAKLDRAAMPNTGLLGRGGMRSKLDAARAAARTGADTWICNGKTPNVLLRMMRGEQMSTRLTGGPAASSARRRWLADRSAIRGTLHLDKGAVRALLQDGASLLPVGIVDVTGQFAKGDLVRCEAPDRSECAVGLSNYSSATAKKIAGCRSGEIARMLKGPFVEEAIHRDHMHVPASSDA